MGWSNRGGGGCRPPRSGPEGPDGARMVVVAGAAGRFRQMFGANWARDSETPGRETHFGCWLSGPTRPLAGASCRRGVTGPSVRGWRVRRRGVFASGATERGRRACRACRLDTVAGRCRRCGGSRPCETPRAGQAAAADRPPGVRDTARATACGRDWRASRSA